MSQKRTIIEFTKRTTEAVRPALDWASALNERWSSGRFYATSTYVRPKRPNGFEYEATDSGQSGSREPRWPKVIGETVVDGSIEWTCRDYGTNAADSIATADTTADSGITIGPTTIDGAKTKFLVSGGTNNSVYEISSYVTLTETSERLEQLIRVTVDDDLGQ